MMKYFTSCKNGDNKAAHFSSSTIEVEYLSNGREIYVFEWCARGGSMEYSNRLVSQEERVRTMGHNGINTIAEAKPSFDSTYPNPYEPMRMQTNRETHDSTTITLEVYNKHHNLGIKHQDIWQQSKNKKGRISPNKMQSAQSKNRDDLTVQSPMIGKTLQLDLGEMEKEGDKSPALNNDLMDRIKNIDGKILGKNGKPLKATTRGVPLRKPGEVLGDKGEASSENLFDASSAEHANEDEHEHAS
ncbi:hypothetical protein Tco_0931292 [Tanacetum coccineum]